MQTGGAKLTKKMRNHFILRHLSDQTLTGRIHTLRQNNHLFIFHKCNTAASAAVNSQPRLPGTFYQLTGSFEGRFIALFTRRIWKILTQGMRKVSSLRGAGS